MAHAARVLSEDSPAVPAGRLAVEQGRITVSDASRVTDEPAEVQLRALERVTGGGCPGTSPARRRGCPRGGLRWCPRLSAVLGRPHGGSGKRRHDGSHQPARAWGEVRRWWCQVRTPALVTLGVGWGLLRAGYRLRPAAVAVVGSVAHHGPRPKCRSGGPESHGEPVCRLFPPFLPTAGGPYAAGNGSPGL